jgi:hypothetical protein
MNRMKSVTVSVFPTDGDIINKRTLRQKRHDPQNMIWCLAVSWNFEYLESLFDWWICCYQSPPCLELSFVGEQTAEGSLSKKEIVPFLLLLCSL